MKSSVKWMLCAVMVVAAVLSLLATLADLGALDAWAAEPYLLREERGWVAVFGPEEDEEPVMVTQIRTATLPRADRLALQEGIAAKNRKELLALLEDLGS